MTTYATPKGGAMPAKIQVKKYIDGFQFVVVGQNGKTLAMSERYASKASCMNGIRALQRAATSAEVEDQTTKEWQARQSASAPVAKAARSVGKAVGKAKAKAEQVVAAPPAATRKRAARKKS
jgi:uncharacterized protein YegP (UPF0339 family)